MMPVLGVAGKARIGGRRVFARQIAPKGAWPPSFPRADMPVQTNTCKTMQN